MKKPVKWVQSMTVPNTGYESSKINL